MPVKAASTQMSALTRTLEDASMNQRSQGKPQANGIPLTIYLPDCSSMNVFVREQCTFRELIEQVLRPPVLCACVLWVIWVIWFPRAARALLLPCLPPPPFLQTCSEGDSDSDSEVDDTVWPTQSGQPGLSLRRYIHSSIPFDSLESPSVHAMCSILLYVCVAWEMMVSMHLTSEGSGMLADSFRLRITPPPDLLF